MSEEKLLLLEERIVELVSVIIAPILLIQILPGLMQGFGLDIMSASLLSSGVTIFLSLGGYITLVRTEEDKVTCHRIKPAVLIIITIATVLFLLFDETIFIWISNHIYDYGLEARMKSIANVNTYAYLIYGLIVAPIAEECLFRIFFYNDLKKYFSWITSMLIMSIMFGLIHMTIAHFVTATLFGVFLTLVFEYTQIIWITIVCHIFYNLSTLALSGKEMKNVASNTVMTVFVFIACVFILSWFTIKRDMMIQKTRSSGEEKKKWINM